MSDDDKGKPSKLRLGTGERMPMDPEMLASAARANREFVEKIAKDTRARLNAIRPPGPISPPSFDDSFLKAQAERDQIQREQARILEQVAGELGSLRQGAEKPDWTQRSILVVAVLTLLATVWTLIS